MKVVLKCSNIPLDLSGNDIRRYVAEVFKCNVHVTPSAESITPNGYDADLRFESVEEANLVRAFDVLELGGRRCPIAASTGASSARNAVQGTLMPAAPPEWGYPITVEGLPPTSSEGDVRRFVGTVNPNWARKAHVQLAGSSAQIFFRDEAQSEAILQLDGALSPSGGILHLTPGGRQRWPRTETAAPVPVHPAAPIDAVVTEHDSLPGGIALPRVAEPTRSPTTPSHSSGASAEGIDIADGRKALPTSSEAKSSALTDFKTPTRPHSVTAAVTPSSVPIPPSVDGPVALTTLHAVGAVHHPAHTAVDLASAPAAETLVPADTGSAGSHGTGAAPVTAPASYDMEPVSAVRMSPPESAEASDVLASGTEVLIEKVAEAALAKVQLASMDHMHEQLASLSTMFADLMKRLQAGEQEQMQRLRLESQAQKQQLKDLTLALQNVLRSSQATSSDTKNPATLPRPDLAVPVLSAPSQVLSALDEYVAKLVMIKPSDIRILDDKVLGQSNNCQVVEGTIRSGDVEVVVAVKRSLDTGVGPPTSSVMKSLLREACKQMVLEHPHVVGIHGYVRGPSGDVQLVMEKMGACVPDAQFYFDDWEPPPKEERTLRGLLESSRGMLGWKHRVRAALHAALGLAHLHHCGILHLDVKPENLLLCQVPPSTGSTEGTAKDRAERLLSSVSIKVGDFGMAKVAKRSQFAGLSTLHTSPAARDASAAAPHVRGKPATEYRSFLGTPHYSAPEQWRWYMDDLDSSEITDKADVYAFGLVLWDLLTFDAGPSDPDEAALRPPWMRELKAAGIVKSSFRDTADYVDALETFIRTAVTSAKRPVLPITASLSVPPPDGWKELVEQCWHPDPACRPAMADVAMALESLAKV